MSLFSALYACVSTRGLHHRCKKHKMASAPLRRRSCALLERAVAETSRYEKPTALGLAVREPA